MVPGQMRQDTSTTYLSTDSQTRARETITWPQLAICHQPASPSKDKDKSTTYPSMWVSMYAGTQKPLVPRGLRSDPSSRPPIRGQKNWMGCNVPPPTWAPTPSLSHRQNVLSSLHRDAGQSDGGDGDWKRKRNKTKQVRCSWLRA